MDWQDPFDRTVNYDYRLGVDRGPHWQRRGGVMRSIWPEGIYWDKQNNHKILCVK